ncbi:MAG TPA: TetR/AcrR family transcriptional regulator [Nannocystaceae bacterium]|nr:TetR/AcrR family transcriptional regulator [Nannocystaceae bacterium]
MPISDAAQAPALGSSKPDVRARILDAAWTIGDGHAAGPLTIRNIAAHAGVSAALLYCYFEGKGALLRELQEVAQPRLENLLHRAIDGGDTPQDRISRLCTTYVGFARRHRWLCAETMDEHARAPRSSRLTNAFLVLLSRLLDAQGAAAEAAEQVRIAIDGLLAAEAGRNPEEDRGTHFVDGYVRMLVRGLSTTLDPIAVVRQ